KVLLNDIVDWKRQEAKQTLYGLVQNAENRQYFMQYVDIQEDIRDLDSPLDDNDRMKTVLMRKQESDCNILSILLAEGDIELRKQIVVEGIAESILKILSTRKLSDIPRFFSSFFRSITYPSSVEVIYLLIQKHPLTPLLRLIDHFDEQIQCDAIVSMSNIIYYGALGSDQSTNHPYYEKLVIKNGIQRIFNLFKVSQFALSKNAASICLGIIFRAREMINIEMQVSIISHLKIIMNHSDKDLRKFVNVALHCLQSNPINKAEIDKDGFTIPIEEEIKEEDNKTVIDN
ncbi:MAG: hypothetical protein EZS28_041534, partial [Streblomastix strix]